MSLTIQYQDTCKALPVDQLARLFHAVGWSDTAQSGELARGFIQKPYINSTLVVSAWEGERLVGAVRVLSDEVVRSVVYDLLVDPDYQGKGIGRELMHRCIAHYPKTEWLLETQGHIVGFYEKLGFKRYGEVVLVKESPYFDKA